MTPSAALPGALHLVATPIGNLEDITFRAVRVLREVTLIAAEDTRRSARLLAHYGISTPTVSYHAHNYRSRQPQLLDRLAAGQPIALVTDAGTPGISDPGSELVAACVAQGIPIDPVPGASASLTAAVASGFPLNPLTIFGFPPSRSSDRSRWISTVSRLTHTFCFFEAPHRVQATLEDMGLIFGVRPMLLARELTKIHQELIRGSASEIRHRLASVKGEFTIVVGPLEPSPGQTVSLTDADIARQFGQLTNSCAFGRRRDAIVELSRRTGVPSRAIYAALERQKDLDE